MSECSAPPQRQDLFELRPTLDRQALADLMPQNTKLFIIFLIKNYRNQKGPGKLTDSGKHDPISDPTWFNMIQHSQPVAWVQTQDLLQVSGQRIAGFDLFPGCNAWVPTALRRRWLKVWMFMMFVDLLLSDSQQCFSESYNICVYIYANNKSGSIILENVKRLCNWLMWSEGHKQQHWSFAIDHVVLRFAGHMCCYQPSYPGVRCESGEGNCEDTTSRP